MALEAMAQAAMGVTGLQAPPAFEKCGFATRYRPHRRYADRPACGADGRVTDRVESACAAPKPASSPITSGESAGLQGGVSTCSA